MVEDGGGRGGRMRMRRRRRGMAGWRRAGEPFQINTVQLCGSIYWRPCGETSGSTPKSLQREVRLPICKHRWGETVRTDDEARACAVVMCISHTARSMVVSIACAFGAISPERRNC
eukprot:4916012-Pyramimonas_sp.AAC.1